MSSIFSTLASGPALTHFLCAVSEFAQVIMKFCMMDSLSCVFWILQSFTSFHTVAANCSKFMDPWLRPFNTLKLLYTVVFGLAKLSRNTVTSLCPWLPLILVLLCSQEAKTWVFSSWQVLCELPVDQALCCLHFLWIDPLSCRVYHLQSSLCLVGLWVLLPFLHSELCSSISDFDTI